MAAMWRLGMGLGMCSPVEAPPGLVESFILHTGNQVNKRNLYRKTEILVLIPNTKCG